MSDSEKGDKRSEHENAYTLKGQRCVCNLATGRSGGDLQYRYCLQAVRPAKRLVHAQENVRKFEAKYGTTPDILESKGLPEDADYEMHEDYIEWHYWARVRQKTQNTLDVLMSVPKGHDYGYDSSGGTST